MIGAPYEGVAGGPPQPNELEQFANLYIDENDPDRNYPLLSTNSADLSAIIPWTQDHPKHCIIGPEREILWCADGHGLENATKDKIRELWAAQ